MTILTVQSLVGGYGAVQILQDISMTVAAGQIVALVGANGAGKSTLLRTIAGLLPIRSGRIEWRGEDITDHSAADRVELGITLVPEGRLVFPTMTVEENLRLGAISPHARSGARERIESMWRLFPRLAERRRQAGASLSGGEQQMLAIARGLMAVPTLLLLDEPTLGLAPQMAALIFETIEKLNHEGLTILLAEQDLSRALALSHHAHVVENGKIALEGSGASLLGDARVKAAYLGR